MLRELEIAFLHFVEWFYTLDPVVGLMTLGVAALALLIAQFFITGNTTLGKTFIPGALGLLFVVAEICHLTKAERISAGAAELAGQLQIERPAGEQLASLPVIEPLVEMFITPSSMRYVWEESLFIVLAGYLFLVGRHSWREYKKTGTIIGDLSVSSLVKDKHRRPKRSMTNELGSGDLANTEPTPACTSRSFVGQRASRSIRRSSSSHARSETGTSSSSQRPEEERRPSSSSRSSTTTAWIPTARSSSSTPSLRCGSRLRR